VSPRTIFKRLNFARRCRQREREERKMMMITDCDVFPTPDVVVHFVVLSSHQIDMDSRRKKLVERNESPSGEVCVTLMVIDGNKENKSIKFSLCLKITVTLNSKFSQLSNSAI
jgi:hypothetical protein